MVEICHAGIISIDGQQILGEVIAADREKVDALGQRPGLVDGGRYLNHYANRWQILFIALLQQLPVAAVNKVEGLIHLGQVADHRQHDSKIPQPLIGLHHSPDLGQENFRMIECHPNTAPTQKGVFLLNREIRQ